ncbi:hypothetical protein KVG29_02550 [Caldicoprobacter algeriensis]|uniref:hypothetical protein n=1 Tax=Caldicoprobacter algeriensis TaxID=699281 RepID=UPI002079F13E|nr:hypothetical protein [Caldicoprobacter algeriensis]MCM8900102.1 hypothetical protein [Caldicoprobacter algeriensis]
MADSSVSSKKMEITLRLSEFEMPPMQDALIIGRKAPIGFEAAKRMVDIISPNQYEVIKVQHPTIEAVVIRKALMQMVACDRLISLILEEGGKVANEATIFKVQLSIVLCVSKTVEL